MGNFLLFKNEKIHVNFVPTLTSALFLLVGGSQAGEAVFSGEESLHFSSSSSLQSSSSSSAAVQVSTTLPSNFAAVCCACCGARRGREERRTRQYGRQGEEREVWEERAGEREGRWESGGTGESGGRRFADRGREYEGGEVGGRGDINVVIENRSRGHRGYEHKHR